MQSWRHRTAGRVIPIVGLFLSLFLQFMPLPADAVFKSAFVRLDRMMISTATGGTVCARPNVSAAGVAKVLVTFPSTYAVGTTAANWTVTTTNMPVIGGTAATAWPGITTASSATSPANVVTFSSSDLPLNTVTYCFNFSGTNTLTTASGAAASQQATIETQTSGSVVLDHSDIALANIANDQIVVSAVVPPTFIFVLSGNTDTFSTVLDPAAIKSTAGRTVTITTNAKGGWIAWAKDSQQGLRSASAAYTIAGTPNSPVAGDNTVNGSPTTVVAGTENYVLDTDLTTDAAGGCTLAIDGEYNGATTSAGGTLSANFQPIAACTGVSPATASGDVITLIERATIAGATPAGTDYTDTITVVGAGNF